MVNDRIHIAIKPIAMIVHTIILSIGLTGFFLAFLQFQKTSHLLSAGQVATAKVIALIEDEGDESTLYRPQFEFRDKEDNRIVFEGHTSSSSPAWTVGESTQVAYDPENPKDIRVVSYWSLYRFTILFTALSSPFFVIGLGYFLFLFTMRTNA